MTTITLTYRAINRKITSLRLPRINWKIVYLSGVLLSLLMLVFYISEVNKLIKGAYLIKSYEKNTNLTLEENRNLEISLAKNSFLGRMADRAKELSFEKTANIQYVQILDDSLAKVK